MQPPRPPSRKCAADLFVRGGPPLSYCTFPIVLDRPNRHSPWCKYWSPCREKDEIIKSLRSRLSIAQQQAQRVAAGVELPVGAAAASAQAQHSGNGGGGHSPLEAQNAQLEGANLQLRQRLQETLGELQAAHDQLQILQQLQAQVRASIRLLAAAFCDLCPALALCPAWLTWQQLGTAACLTHITSTF